MLSKRIWFLPALSIYLRSFKFPSARFCTHSFFSLSLSLSDIRTKVQSFPRSRKFLKYLLLIDRNNSDGYIDPDAEAEDEKEQSDSESLIIICWWWCWWWILLAWIICCHQHSHLVSSSLLTTDNPHSISYSFIYLYNYILYVFNGYTFNKIYTQLKK